MRGANAAFIEAALDLAWSHWTALGVRGVAQPPSTAVDPEALLYFTACLVEHDPRLRDEVSGWWGQFERFISRSRMTALAKKFGDKATSKLAALEEALRGAARRGKSRLDHLNTPARSLLRLRSVFGVNARAEILLELLTRQNQRDEGMTVLALAEVGYSKRNVAVVLDDLRMAGILVAAAEGNRTRFRLDDPVGLERVLRPLPQRPGRWHVRLPVIAAFVDLAGRLHGRDAVVQGIEARKMLEANKANLAAAGTSTVGPGAAIETYWPALQRWLIDNVIAADSDSMPRVAGMIDGMWLGPNQAADRPVRFSSAVLPRVSANPSADRELLCLDLVQVPSVGQADAWDWAVLSTAATSTYAHTIGLDRHERWRFMTWHFGDARMYEAAYAEPLPRDRIARVFGKVAASRARADQPAVQLRLTRLDTPP